MVLGISSSGRENGMTSQAVKKVLDSTGQEYEYISLSGKAIRGCTGCLGCARDNICKVKDDWNLIGQKMKDADAIVFGGTNYFNMLNALGQATLERTFSFRHMERFLLAGKLGVIVSCGYKPQNNPVKNTIKMFMESAKMSVIGSVEVGGYSQCYSCGPGIECAVGNIVKDHGFISEVLEEHLPKDFNQQEEAKLEAYKAGKILGSILRARSQS
jgi:multimeric flavodoxin WrbA